MLEVEQRSLAEEQLRAARGGFRCAVCKTDGVLAEGVTVWFRKSLVFAVHLQCFAQKDVLFSMNDRGLSVGLKEKRLIIPASAIPSAPTPQPEMIRKLRGL